MGYNRDKKRQKDNQYNSASWGTKRFAKEISKSQRRRIDHELALGNLNVIEDNDIEN